MVAHAADGMATNGQQTIDPLRYFASIRMQSSDDAARSVRRSTVSEVLPPRQVLTLTLRPERDESRNRRVSWEADVREPVNQRVSKCCCVFHKKRLFGESDSDSSSSDSDCDDNNNDIGGAAESSGHPHAHHAHGHGCCGHHEHARKTDDPSVGADDANKAPVVTIKRKKPRPKCTKESCLCGTRFS